MATTGYPEDDSELFAASRVKILRANEFIAELEAEAADYVASSPIKFVRVIDNEKVELQYAGITLKPSAITGDCIHNLRSALDLMASELSRANHQSDNGVYFPFSEKADDYDLLVKKKNFHRCGDDAVGLLKTFEPYHGGNFALRALHDLDVQDKHKALGIARNSFSFTMSGFYDITDIQSGKFEAKITEMYYVFADGPFVGNKVVETLKDLVNLVKGILEAFAGLVASRA